MTFKENGKVPSSVDEIDWRHVWLANAVITSGPILPHEIPRYRSPPRHPSSRLRLRKLHRLRAALHEPRWRLFCTELSTRALTSRHLRAKNGQPRIWNTLANK